MTTPKTKKKPTTIAADPQVRDVIKEIARRMDIPQRKCLSIIIDEKIHRDKIAGKRKREELEQLDVPDAINQINRRLEKIEKRENPRDTIVSFFRTQEREILKPMNAKVESLSAKLDEIITALNSIQ